MPSATETELLGAIRRDPSDLHAVRVYADWLLDRGDSRGELIVLQEREAELDPPHLLRLLELATEHGFVHLPVDPEADVLRFAGGVRVEHDELIIDYELARDGVDYHVFEWHAMLAIEVDGAVVFTDKPRGLIRPEVANVILSIVSAAILAGEPDAFRLTRITLPDNLAADPRYRVGRFPTEPIPDELAARWPRSRDWHIDLRDLARWRALAARWQALR